VNNTREILGKIAAEYYNQPSLELTVIGVTGTNGKTTISTVLFRLLKKMGYKSGLISTVENIIHDKKIKATHTDCVAR